MNNNELFQLWLRCPKESERAFLAELTDKQRLALVKLGEKSAAQNALMYYKPYPYQVKFHSAGKEWDRRLLVAANKIGKTWAGAYECAMHLTGLYPDWWEGRRFAKPIRMWASSNTIESTKLNPQQLLLGPPE